MGRIENPKYNLGDLSELFENKGEISVVVIDIKMFVICSISYMLGISLLIFQQKVIV